MAISPQSTETAGYTVTTTTTVTPERIADLMISFIESGVSRFWCSGVFLETPGSYVPDLPGSRIWYANAGLYAADDWMIRVVEDEDETGDPETGKAHLISRKEFQKGLELLASGDYARHFADIINENDDAGTADIFMQFILFGEEVYA